MKTHRTHDKSRKVVCVICFPKCLKGRCVAKSQEELIQKLIPTYSLADSSFPNASCDLCRKKLSSDQIVSTVHYHDINIKVKRIAPCDCKICEVARLNHIVTNIYSIKID